MLLTTLIFNGLLLALVAAVSIRSPRASTALKAALVAVPVLVVGNRIVIPSIHKPLTLEEYRETKRQRVRWWRNHFKERTLSKISHLPSHKEECQVFIHHKAFDVVKVGALQEVEGFEDKTCVFSETDSAALIWQIEQSTHRDIFVLGHGVLDQEGRETFAGGFLYEEFSLASQGDR